MVLLTKHLGVKRCSTVHKKVVATLQAGTPRLLGIYCWDTWLVLALGLLLSSVYIIKITSILRLRALLCVVVVVWMQDTGMASIRRVRRMLALPLGAVIPVEVDFRQGVEDSAVVQVSCEVYTERRCWLCWVLIPRRSDYYDWVWARQLIGRLFSLEQEEALSSLSAGQAGSWMSVPFVFL